MLEYAQFDPIVDVPLLPEGLRADEDVHLHIVQFHRTPTDADRAAVESLGGVVRGYLPHDCHIVQMGDGGAALYALESVRWVGAYEPAYRLEPYLLGELSSGMALPTRRYNMVMVDKRRDKQALADAVGAMGGAVYDRHEGGLLFTADLNHAQLLQAARLDTVLWIDRWTTVGEDMDNARIQGGANYVEAVGGYTGSGIIGHVYEGVEGTHPDFTTPIQQRGPAVCAGATNHGHCTAGIVFGNGTSNPAVRGMAPDALGLYTRYFSATNSTCATSPSRNTIIGSLVNTDQVMFTTASWGNDRTFNYTSVSADADDIVFDHRIPWTQSQSNAGNQDSRPQAWAKNIISVGAAYHFGDSDPSNDSWNNGGSTGPAQDGRNKPDLAAYYDAVGASDLTGAAGYSPNNWTSGFGGTSAATPIVAGHNALAIQMYTDGLFQVDLAVPGGTRFQNRPMAQTLKALQMAAADMYTPTPTDNRREHVGYGFPSLRNLYDRRDKITIVPEDAPITQGATHVYNFNVAPGESIVKFVMTYLDPAGNPAAAFDRINDLTMRVTRPDGTSYWGNNGLDGVGQTNQSATGGSADTHDTVEAVVIENPAAGVWTVEITAPTLTQDAYLATAATDAVYALVVNGGTAAPTPVLTTTFASNNGSAVGGAVYFSLEALAGSGGVTISDIDLNCDSLTIGNAVSIDVYLQPNGGSCSYDPSGVWALKTTGTGINAGIDNATNFVLTTPLEIGEGCCVGVAIVANGFGHRYTNGATNPVVYSNAGLQLTAGAGSNVPFSSLFFEPRVVNINVNYALGGSCSDTGVATSYGAGCVDTFTSFYEVLTQAGMDMSGLEIWGTATAGGHQVNTRPATIMPIGSLGTAAPLALGDDDQVTAGTLGLSVGSNGWVARGIGNSSGFTPNVPTMLANPSEAFYAWTDLQPNAAGSGLVHYEESGTQWMVTYDGVYLWNTTAPVTIQFRGDESNGDFAIAFGAVGNTGSQGWLIGHSGAGASSDPGPRDLSQATITGFLMADADRAGLGLAAVNSPVLGGAFQLQTTNIPATAVFHVGILGLSQMTVPLAFAFPAANLDCSLYTSVDLMIGPQLVVGGPGSLTWTGIDLSSVSLLGANVYFQAATLKLSSLGSSLRTSNGVEITTGLY